MQREVRKTVSVVFSDVAGSTALAERLDPESLRTVMTRYFEVAKRVHEGHGGVVEKFIGDAVMAVFGIPRAREDDALRAVRAAAELGEAVAMLNRELEGELEVTLSIRTGVCTGLVLADDERAGHSFVGGDTVNLAARLERAAGAGEVLLGETTWRLVAGAVRAQPLAPFVPRGRSAPVTAYRLLEVTPDTPGLPRRPDVPLVGRAAELAVLGGMLDRAVALGACQLVTVVGDPGVGKSRLLRAFSERAAGRAVVLTASCPAYGVTAASQVVGQIVAGAAAAVPGGRRAWPAEVAATDPRGLFRGVRRLLERLAADHPVVLTVDDLHWADPLLLDLLDYLAMFVRDAALLLVVAGRRPLADRPDPIAGAARTRLVLDPLSAGEAAELAATLRRPGRLEGAVGDRLATLANGNPLVITELLCRREDAAEALVGAELDGLPSEERAVLEAASVLGQVFDWPSVAALAPAPLGPRVGGLLLDLARRNLIRVADRAFGDDAFRFRHGLLRDAAYEAIPKRRRLVLHARAAELLAERLGEDDEDDEGVGHHLGQASRYLAQLAGHEPAPLALAVRPDHRPLVGVPA
ncbi:MAG TPA: AAA family ATPase [Actinomycetota bacterium]|nr:AAA family ATPase [Actinomycetota bacterium]